MDYNTLTKAELVKLLEEQKHLAKAVEAKDTELILAQEKIDEANARVDEILKQYTGSMTKEQIDKYTKELTEQRDYALEIANLYITVHTDLLKQTQQNLEMAVFTEGLISQKIKK